MRKNKHLLLALLFAVIALGFVALGEAMWGGASILLGALVLVVTQFVARGPKKVRPKVSGAGQGQEDHIFVIINIVGIIGATFAAISSGLISGNFEFNEGFKFGAIVFVLSFVVGNVWLFINR